MTVYEDAHLEMDYEDRVAPVIDDIDDDYGDFDCDFCDGDINELVLGD